MDKSKSNKSVVLPAKGDDGVEAQICDGSYQHKKPLLSGPIVSYKELVDGW